MTFSDSELRLIVATASLIVLLASSLGFGLCYSLYGHTFFLFVGIGWLTNAVYVLLELLNYNSRTQIKDSFEIYLLGNVSTLFFLVAACNLRRESREKRASKLVYLFLACAIIPSSWFILDTRISSSQASKYFIMVTPGVVFSAAVFISIGTMFFLKSKEDIRFLIEGPSSPLPEERAKELGRIVGVPHQYIPLSTEAARFLQAAKLFQGIGFTLYGILQIGYLFQPLLRDLGYSMTPYYYGLSFKTLIGFAVPMFILSDFRQFAEAIRFRSLSEELGALTASIEHDINNPISIINKKLVLMRKEFQAENRVITYVGSLDEQLRRIRVAVDIIPAWKESPEYCAERFRCWNCVDIVHSALKAARIVNENSDVRLDVIPTRDIINIEANRERLIQAFVNIINNGIEACLAKKGQASRRVVVRCDLDKEKHHVLISFKDNGIGLNRALLSRIGSPMFSTKDRTLKPNRGLGVFTAKRFIEQHRGSFSFESDGETYTVAIVKLPLATKPNVSSI